MTDDKKHIITAAESPDLAGMTYEEVADKMLGLAAIYAARAGLSTPEFRYRAAVAHEAVTAAVGF